MVFGKVVEGMDVVQQAGSRLFHDRSSEVEAVGSQSGSPSKKASDLCWPPDSMEFTSCWGLKWLVKPPERAFECQKPMAVRLTSLSGRDWRWRLWTAAC